MPYTVQSNTPAVKATNIDREMSFVDLDFHVFITCGRNENVVNAAAANPIISSIRTPGSDHYLYY